MKLTLSGLGLMDGPIHIPALYTVVVDQGTVNRLNAWIQGHKCRTTFEVPSGKEIPLPIERRRWSVDLSTCQVGHFANAICTVCESKASLLDDLM